MLKKASIENIIGLVLTIGMSLSAVLIMIGALLYLIQHGNEPWQIILTPAPSLALTLIKTGLIVLVGTQIARVGILAGFYAYLRDYWFVSFSIFILGILIYSVFIKQ
jgi:uncharacterized membrane protein